MNSVIQLSSPEGFIQIYAGDKDWCPCVLFHGRLAHYLGADSLGAITRRLLPVLSTSWEELEAPVAGEVDGYQVRCVLALAEAHTVLYVASDGDDRLLL